MGSRKHFYWVATIASAAVLYGCAGLTPQPACHEGESALTLDTLYFGTASPAGPVTPEQWRSFVERVVSVEFPKGYTVLRAEGAWRGESGELQREDSYMVQLVHEDNAAASQAIGRIINHYKREFQQEAVLRMRAPSCATF
jgi:hypothetical protein